MPLIKSSTDLRNHYNEVSTVCHDTGEPVFITKNGRGDLAVMSIDVFEDLTGKKELYQLLADGQASIRAGRKKPLHDAMSNIRQDLADGTL
ncbi:MAG: type II toxin-antitoxin system Phd/YefM family antitoxin [Coriobacteriales bacterium]|jgi:prevent-host-death family protein|nr:type II toxin-antitoxin system Phd/YefM family antitoxin [Coriobacteriales bacterium]